jgi:hypothetical protein
LAHW